MLKSRFLWRLFGGYAVLVVLAVAIVGMLVVRRIGSDTVRDTERSLRTTALMLRAVAGDQLAGRTVPLFGERIHALRDSVDVRLTVIAADGTVLADTDEEPAGMDNHGNRPEIVAARDSGAGVATRFSRTVAARLMYYAVAVEDNGRLVGFARAAVPLTSVQQRLASVRRLVGVGALLAAAVTLLAGLLLARRLAAPLASMTTAAQSIAEGAYRQRVTGTAPDEIGQLAHAFNRMAAELETRINTIAEDRAKLLTILGGMVEGVVAVDRDEHVVHLNAKAAALLEAPPGENVGKPIWEITRVRQVTDAIAETLKRGDAVTGELRLDHRAADRIVEMRAAPLRDFRGTLTGVVMVLHEVTSLRQLETVRRDFVANVSHELKTPITAIRGLVETILDHQDMEPAARREFLGKIQRQANRLSTLVTDLLALARLEAAEETPVAEAIDLGDTVRISADNFRARADEVGVQVTVDVPHDRVHVVGDSDGLELMLNNLVDNAIKYTPRGGNVSIHLRTEGDTAVLEVCDTGVGIAREHHDRIFERFYRVDKARSRKLGGTGLGLSIVKHISKAHGGSVAVESAPASGSTFRIRLPLAGPQVAPEGAS